MASAEANYTYTATSEELSDSETFTITVNAAPTLSAPPDQTYIANQAITTITLEAATGGTEPFTYELSTNLPAGLSFDTGSRELSGTPTTPTTGAVTVTYTAKDANDAVATATFDITVDAANSPPTVANAIPDQDATVGTAFSYTFPENTFNDVNNDTLTYAADLSSSAALPT